MSLMRAREAWAIIGIEHELEYKTLEAGETNSGATIRWGRDKEGRFCLLVATKQFAMEPVRYHGAELALTRVSIKGKGDQLFCVLTCRETLFLDLFESFVEDLRSSLLKEVGDAMPTCLNEFEKWRKFFEVDKNEISREREIGLFGELTLLEQLADWKLPAVKFWLGPTGHRHDFCCDGFDIECKATEGNEFMFTINGAHQLEEPENGNLFAFAVRLECHPSGETIVSVVDRLRHKTDSLLLAKRLVEAGMAIDLKEDNCRRLKVVESRLYRVEPGFPRIISKQVSMPGVTGLTYRSDFSVAQDCLIDLDTLKEQFSKEN